MNDERRKKLQRVITLLSDAQNYIEEVKSDEEEVFENLPENMREGDKGSKIQAAIHALAEAYDSIDQATDSISSAME